MILKESEKQELIFILGELKKDLENTVRITEELKKAVKEINLSLCQVERNEIASSSPPRKRNKKCPTGKEEKPNDHH